MQIITKDNNREAKEHGSFSFPVYISVEQIQAYEHGTFLWHWHPEIELTWIMSGEMEYQINDAIYKLSAGDGIFGNSNSLHTGRRINGHQCTYLSITFHPRFLYGYENSILQTKYVGFITSNESWASLALKQDVEWQKEILDVIKEIYELSKTPEDDFELSVHRKLMYIWHRLYLYYSVQPERGNKTLIHIQRLREILTFIHENYTTDISLDEIAEYTSLSKSECCRFFKKHMDMTIFDYILYYKIQKSLPMLLEDQSITDTAFSVGFSSASYYTQIFKRYMKCTPLQYKKSLLMN
mgnify:FL=1